MSEQIKNPDVANLIMIAMSFGGGTLDHVSLALVCDLLGEDSVEVSSIALSDGIVEAQVRSGYSMADEYKEALQTMREARLSYTQGATNAQEWGERRENFILSQRDIYMG